MKKTVLAIAGSAVIVFSGLSFAATAEHQNGKTHHHAYSSYRDSNALSQPSYGYGYGSEAEPEWYRYGGGYSDMAGH